MSSDRFKRKEVGTLRQRWKMKHKDRADDIPNCPSIENIVDMPIFDEIPSSEKTAVSNAVTDSPLSNAKLKEDNVQQQTTSTGQENSTKLTTEETSEFAIQGSASERRDDIPMCPDIENICELDQSQLDDDMSVHRFSHALYQLLDDFLLLLTKFAQFLKDHPRPATIVSFIVASYLIIIYLELSIAALIELIAQAIWPISHAMLLFIERCILRCGGDLV
uniref:Transmembrane anterior posterior n=1 Tax=Elaeophora elaphi TaxID=1147741 RepID=A0A0R3RTH5_9BILA